MSILTLISFLFLIFFPVVSVDTGKDTIQILEKAEKSLVLRFKDKQEKTIEFGENEEKSIVLGIKDVIESKNGPNKILLDEDQERQISREHDKIYINKSIRFILKKKKNFKGSVEIKDTSDYGTFSVLNKRELLENGAIIHLRNNLRLKFLQIENGQGNIQVWNLTSYLQGKKQNKDCYKDEMF